MADMDLQIKIEASSDQAVKSIKTLSDRIRDLGRTIKQAGASGGLMAIGSGIDTLGRSLDKFERSAKQFGRDLTTYVTAPILALAGLSLRKIFQDAFEGIGTGPMLQFGAQVQALKETFDNLLRTIGQDFAPAATKIAAILTNLIQKFLDLDKETRKQVVSWGLLAAAIGPVILAIGAFAGILGKAFIALAPLVTGFGKLLAAINPLVAGLVGVAVAIVSAGNLFIDLRKTGLTAFESLAAMGKLLSATLDKYLLGTFIKIDTALAKLFRNKDIVQQNEAFLKEIEANFDNTVAEINATLAPLGTDLANSLTFGFTNAIAALKGSFLETIDELSTETNTKMWTKLDEDAKAASESIRRNLSYGVTNALTEIADGTKTAGEAFANFARQTIRQLTQMVTQALIFRSLFPEGGAVDGITTRIGAILNPPGAATGGYVSGPGTGTSDSILARLSNGEFVSDAKTVKFFGPDFFHNLKRMAGGVKRPPSGSMIPGFATGGLVGGGGGGSAPSIVIQNSGSPKEAVGTEYDPSTAVTTVILEDLQKNGSIARGIQSTYGIRRGGYR